MTLQKGCPNAIVRRSGFLALLAAFAVLAAATAFAGRSDGHSRGTPRVYQLSPRRIEQRIDARGHDQLSLQAAAATPPFNVTVRFLDPETNRPLAVVTLPTDGKMTQTLGAPLPIFRVQLRASVQRDFQLTLTLL
jgi:hypothetical protein